MRYVSQERVIITATNNYYSKWQPPLIIIIQNGNRQRDFFGMRTYIIIV